MKNLIAVTFAFTCGLIFGTTFLSPHPVQYITPVDLRPLTEKIDSCKVELEEEVESNSYNEDLHSEFIDERCVCVSWHSSNDEPSMTKQEICSSNKTNREGF